MNIEINGSVLTEKTGKLVGLFINTNKDSVFIINHETVHRIMNLCEDIDKDSMIKERMNV
jgi:hypothetical protein